MKVVFLDRDGVINIYPGEGRYVNKWGEFSFIPGSIEGIRKLNEKGFKVFVVSNQAGVAKGLYTFKDLLYINKKMTGVLKKQGAFLEGIHYCIHQEGQECSCRKPKTGLLQRALKESKTNPRISFLVGDSLKDIKTAVNFGAKSILVLSGKEKIANRNKWDVEPDYIFDNLLVAAYYICSHYG
ncbi:MAG: HAD-IIIA family hydrolase [Candidatus Omnitrophica bacterium]|nr:HAD-IIIA family hydrolase [Candidatus Omnitrophota bacterium]MBD3269844.1 HAD-IIIA family hydrolase [Candidatus Omnitrophota bacterium]